MIKKFFTFFIFFLTILTELFAEDMQIVFPKTIYTGDTIEIRYIFHSDANIFTDELFNEKTASLTLSCDYQLFEEHKEEFTLTSAILEKNSSDYTLSLKLVPWKNGYLQFPAFDLTAFVRYSQKMVGNGQPYLISLKPVQINSIIEKTQQKKMQPPSPPKVLPGTTLYLILLFILFVLIFSALIFIISRIPVISAFLEKLSYLLSLKKNSRRAVAKLKRLLKNSEKIESDRDYAMEMQLIIRDFLKGRFSRSFNSVPTSAIYQEFLDLAGGQLDDLQENAVEMLIEIFFRTDYVRYASEGIFTENERKTLTDKCLSMLEAFDAEKGENEC